MAALTDEQLQAIVSRQIQLAKDHDKQERETDRSKALDYYFGRMDAYVPPETNRSKVVSRDVADTIGWMLPQIIRVFTASDRMAVAEPVGEEDIQFAKEATDGLNYVFWKDNKGYQIIYSATWDALLTGNGIVKTYYDETPVYKVSFHSGLSEDQVAQLLMPDDDGEEPEVLAKSEESTTIVDPETGAGIEVRTYDIKIKRKVADGKFCIEPIAPEKFLKDGDSTDLDDGAFNAHWERKTRSELIQMGYPKADVWSIPVAARTETPEEQARRLASPDTEQADKATEIVDYYECFIRIDVDDDGEAEMVRACFGGSDNGKLLDWEVWEDEQPFDDIPCEPIPHRWTARSIADETIDVQDVKTVLTRQMLNNVYAANNPQRHAKGKFQNPDELINPTFGGTVFGDTSSEVIPLGVPFFANHALEALAYEDEVIQRRTGVGRNSMALDPETLQNQSATANQNEKDAAYSQVELVARNMAEWGWSKVFRKLLKLMIKHQGPRRLMLNDKPVPIDPRFWNADMDVTINVGLGTGSRDRDMSMLNVIMNVQRTIAQELAAIPGGQAKALEFLPKVMNAANKMAESSGLRNPSAYFPEIGGQDLQQMMASITQAAQQGDPKVAADREKAAAQIQTEREKSAAQVQLEQMKAASDLTIQREKMAQEAELKQAQLAAEMQLKREQLAAELQLKRELSMAEMEMKRQVGFYSADTKAATSSVHMGGEPG